MSLRPAAARWFEILTTWEDLQRTVDTLARTRSVELESQSTDSIHPVMPELRSHLEEFQRIARRYQLYWPRTVPASLDVHSTPKAQLNRALTQLRNWVNDAKDIVEQIEQLQAEQVELSLISELLHSVQSDSLDFSLLAQAGPVFRVRLFVLPLNTRDTRQPQHVMLTKFSTAKHVFVLALGLPEEIDSLQQELALQKGRSIELPQWLADNAQTAGAQVSAHQTATENQLITLRGRLAELNREHKIKDALSYLCHLEWFLKHVSDLKETENFAWITGWAKDTTGEGLNTVLLENDIKAIVHFPPAPPDLIPPMVLNNPSWAKPFEMFVTLLGTPTTDEADPSRILAFLAPLLFGYMFGDVGHGLVLLGAGLLLGKRWPFMRFFIAAGLSSIIFGFVFGSVFTNEQLIAPLWVHPLEHPLPVLLVPMAGGIVVLFLGLILNGVEAFWQNQAKEWWQVEAAVVVLYLSLIGVVFSPYSLFGLAFGLVWYFVGSAFREKKRLSSSLLRAFGTLLESLIQLIINTVSFIRVGAFALAHAGLALAFNSLAQATNHPVASMFILVLGNIIIILLEGLVVSIQTTRLILFEFFIRFMTATGRIFKPLEAPPKPPAAD